MPPKNFIFTSESVTEGHPDKIADQISDAVLDAMIEQDPESRVACETLITTGLVVISAEITTKSQVDIQQVARDTIREIGYTDSAMGFDANTCSVLLTIDKQSPDIALGVNRKGAGDQGLMFGYACDETEEFMPSPILYAHKLARRLSEVRKDGTLPFLRPDGKSQVTFRYEDGEPVGVDAVVISSQHSEDVSREDLHEGIRQNVIDHCMGTLISKNTKIHINPTGNFVIGGPMGDTGLTGRKIIVDTYGGWSRHGGRGVFRERSFQGRQKRGLYGKVHSEKHSRGLSCLAMRSADCLRYRSRGTGFGNDRDLRHGRFAGREDLRGRKGSFRSYSRGDNFTPRAPKTHLQKNRFLRAFRQERRNVLLGENRQNRGT